jgi:glucose/arabinose dehydrogenase
LLKTHGFTDKLYLMSYFLKTSLLFFVFLTSCTNAQDSRFIEVINGFQTPVGMTNAGDGTGRLFVIEKSGKIRIIQQGQMMPEPFLDLSTIITPNAATEQGLLGLAFDPNYESNGRFFINYTDFNGSTVIARYQVSANANQANPDSAVIVLTIEQPFWNHNGGHIAFGPDGYLYIGMGDGGDGHDPGERAEDLTKLLGKMLRLDVSGDTYAVPSDNPFSPASGAKTEIWAYGLRNPWKFSFDGLTGDLYIGDVGQGNYEEINFQSTSSKGGENYGWDTLEGNHCHEPKQGCDAGDSVLPILEYDHSEGVSVTGGYVYRGKQIPSLQGKYLFGDFGSKTIWVAKKNGDTWSREVFEQTRLSIASFAEDEIGELYIVDFGGSVYQLVK